MENGGGNQDEIFGVFYRNGRRTSLKDSDTDDSKRDDGDNYDHAAFMEQMMVDIRNKSDEMNEEKLRKESEEIHASLVR